MKLNPLPNFLFVAIVAATTTGCATYRVSSNFESAPTASFPAVQVLLAEDGLAGGQTPRSVRSRCPSRS